MKKSLLSEEIWDVIVIGGGASGMMAAGRAAEMGAKVLLLEKNESLGKKLLITGGGRCNVTNAEEEVRKFLSKFKDSDKFLFSAFSQFAVKDALDFFHTRNMETKVEALGRVFPITDSAKSVWDVLIQYLKNGKVTVKSKCPVIGLEKEEGKIIAVTLKGGEKIKAKSFILSTGGKSRPETGSTGDGFKFLSEIGHKVIEPKASLVPIKSDESWIKRLQGVSVLDVKVTILQNNVKQESKIGKILFTHFGLSGPTILNLSSTISELLKYGEVFLSLDILPSYDPGVLNAKLQEIFKSESNKKIKNSLDALIHSALVPVVLELAGVNPDTQNNSVTRENRLKLIQTLKNIQLKVSGLLGLEKAVITSGGVDLREVDFKTMSSKLYPNLYITGDILNIDRPTGGYSLQLCWTTGYIAGSNTTKF